MTNFNLKMHLGRGRITRYCTSLENWRALRALVGSNPTLSVFCETKNGEVSPSISLAAFSGGRMERRTLRSRVVMYFVYIPLNEKRTKTYTGVSDDAEQRLKEHNAGKAKSSKPYRPYRIIHMESFGTLTEARRREKFYKSTTGRRRIKEMFLNLESNKTVFKA